ncbi:GUN4 domain-containing protein [Aerosakkonemataceae cyanobacterium BLCC-F50]|uniref:non-specific serine/threonine protein kinase n=1 Tax=Floridaenema flaviceps BLCC-F50 TaxID=3153642 RepID=A0ABV4XTL2_9CYAN
MLYCSNPSCSNPFNPDSNKFCQSCGSQSLNSLFKNRFRVLQLLGEGGFGRTYQAIDTHKMNDACVIKQFVPQVEGTAALEKATELFKQEAKRLFDLGEHPQIPRLIAYFEDNKRLYLVQEFIQGQNLLQELHQQGAFSEKKITQLLHELLPVLQFVHERGVIHRDIKPENIMRRQDGKLMLIDFGVSKQVTGTVLSKLGTMVGTSGYAPMEQMRGQVFPASDLYSLGVTCIRLLTNCLPKEDGSDDIYDGLNGCWKWRDRIPFNQTLNVELGEVLDKLTQDFVKDRYQSAEEVLQELNPPVNSPSSTIINFTQTGINYANLRNFLADGKWREADEETANLFLLVSQRETEGLLTVENIQQLPCEFLCNVDRLWKNYSNGRFGFSTQKRIWQDVQKNTESFGVAVGWCSRVSNWGGYKYVCKSYYGLSFNLNAPVGHLPAKSVIIGRRWGENGDFWVFRYLFAHVESCGL